MHLVFLACGLSLHGGVVLHELGGPCVELPGSLRLDTLLDGRDMDILRGLPVDELSCTNVGMLQDNLRIAVLDGLLGGELSVLGRPPSGVLVWLGGLLNVWHLHPLPICVPHNVVVHFAIEKSFRIC